MTDFMDRHFRHLQTGRKEYTEAEVRLIIDGAAAAEREECAKVCDGIQKKNEDEGAWMWEAKNCAATIRARGQHD